MKTNHNNSPISVHLKDLFIEVKRVISMIFSSRANLLHALLLLVPIALIIGVSNIIVSNILIAIYVGVAFPFWVGFVNDLRLGSAPSFKKTFARIITSFWSLAVFSVMYLIVILAVLWVGVGGWLLFLLIDGGFFVRGWNFIIFPSVALLFLIYGGWWLLLVAPATFGHSLITLQGLPALEALKYSIIGSLKNIKLLILLGTVTTIIVMFFHNLIVPSHISFGLSCIVTIPIYFIFICTAYYQIWPTSSGHNKTESPLANASQDID